MLVVRKRSLGVTSGPARNRGWAILRFLSGGGSRQCMQWRTWFDRQTLTNSTDLPAPETEIEQTAKGWRSQEPGWQVGGSRTSSERFGHQNGREPVTIAWN